MVDVNFNSEVKSIICVFLNQPRGTIKECSANISYGTNCGQWLGLYTNEDTGDSVSIPELPLIEGVSKYCFTVTARSGNVTVNVEGTLNLIALNIIGEKQYDCVENKIVSYFLCTNLIGIATPAAVVPVVVVFGVGALITILVWSYYQFKRSLIIIRFSNPDKPGSLAQMLKVFKVICMHAR